MASEYLSVRSETKLADLGNRKLAYRVVGEGSPIILANRFRGNLDTWDPAFLDALAQTNKIITFDYAGLGRSTGQQARQYLEMAHDMRDLAKALGISKFVAAGWSLGGFVVQILATEFPGMVSHGVLIGTRPPGKDVPPVPLKFFDYSLKADYTFDDEIELFFNSKYESSRQAAKESRARIALRTQDNDIPLTAAQWDGMLKMTDFLKDEHGTCEKMKTTRIPFLSLVGEDDISFPVEDWFARKGQFPSCQLIYLPQTGHGPQHQFPELSARYIDSFLKTSGA